MKIVDIASTVLNGALALGIFTGASYAYANEIDRQESVDYDTQMSCIAQNVYFEARSESELGMRAVAWVTMNRVNNSKYPTTACQVVRQANLDESNNPIRHKCQFSWYCDGKSDKIENQAMWVKSILVAADVIANYGVYPDPTGGSVMYHANYVRPFLTTDYERVVQIDAHIFYK